MIDRLSHAPQFVLNTIFHAPSIVEHKDVLGCLPKKLTFKYVIDRELAGVLEEPEQIVSNGDNSAQLSKFINLIRDTAFENQDRLKGLTSVILLNRMKSIDPSYNDDFEQLPINTSVKCYACKTLWSPIWKCEATGKKVGLEDVKKYYDSLSEYDKVQFLKYEKDCSSKIIPYAALRDCLLHNNTTKIAVQTLRAIDQTSPIFIAFTDKDTISFNYAFDKYLETISKHPKLVCLTSGYKISSKNLQISHAQKANNLDYMIRLATESIIPYSTYFTDLNTIVRVLPEQDTLQEIFPHRYYKKAADQRNEMKYFLENITEKRYQEKVANFAEKVMFVPGAAVITTAPDRFFKNKRGGDLVFNNPDSYTISDLKKFRCSRQSHAAPMDWSANIYMRFKESITGKNVQIDGAPNGLKDMNLKKNVVISLLATLYKYYSPINNLIQTYTEESDVIEAINDSSKVQISVYTLITLGMNDKTDTGRLYSAIGNALRTKLKNIKELKNILGSFFLDESIVDQIENAAKACCNAEHKFLAQIMN